MPIQAVLIDVGFTLVVCDADEIASSAAAARVWVEPAAIRESLRPIYAEMRGYAWPTHPGSSASSVAGSLFFRRLLELAGARGDIPAAAEKLWKEHLQRNIWRTLLPGVADALAALRKAGFRLAAVSNSEGTVEQLLIDLGLRGLFETVVDSWNVGVSKPDPRIFEVALTRIGAPPDRAIMVGDSLTADVEGARRVGMEGVLIDPYDLHRDAAVTRFRSFADFARDFLDKAAPVESAG